MPRDDTNPLVEGKR
jgi:hypothetical protein